MPVLSSETTPSVLDKPIPSEEQTEPPSKRAKSEDPSPTSSTIADKVVRDEYVSLDELADDVSAVVRSRLSEASPKPTAEEANALSSLRKKAIELIKSELSYPQTFHPATHRPSQVTTLTLTPSVPNAQQLYSSLPIDPAAANLAVSSGKGLPGGLSATTLTSRSIDVPEQTLGDVLPAPPNRTPLLPAAATVKAAQPRPNSRGNVLGFYHPELSEASMPRPDGYSGSQLAVGHYLDYTKATPNSPVKTKRRERAQSLAGHKPSSSELEASEMESLFRTAFSSFAPCKDDSGAVVPSTVAGRMWWQQKGQHDFQNQISAEYGPEEPTDGSRPTSSKEDEDTEDQEEIDDGIIEEIITGFDPAIVFPSLRRPNLEKGEEASEEDVEALLQEVDDLILTLASSQHIRNGTKSVTSTNRLAVEEADMLTNTQLPEPSEIEVQTYEALKSLLISILHRLPPYAIAKLNGDQLDELLVSTKLPIHLDDYHGTMGEDEAAVNARARQRMQQQQQQQRMQQPAVGGRTPVHHRPSNTPAYSNHHHANSAQFVQPPQSRTPVPHPQYYRTASGHAATPNSVPRPQQHLSPTQHHVQPQRAASQQYRTNGYTAPFAPQLAKTQTPYGHQGLAQYTPGSRPQQTPAPYVNNPQHGSPSARYANPYQGSYPQQQPVPAAHQQYGGYTNGAAPHQSSPQVGHAPPPYAQTQYQHQAQQQQPQQVPPRYGTPVNQTAAHPRTQSMQNNTPMTGPVSDTPGLTGYRTVMPESEQHRMMEQARVRAAAQERASGYGQAAGAISGLAGQSANRTPTQAAGSPATPMQQGGPPPPQGGMPNGSQSSQGLPYVPAKVSPVPVPVIPPQRPASQPNQPPYPNAQAAALQGQEGAQPQQPAPEVAQAQRPPSGAGE